MRIEIQEKGRQTVIAIPTWLIPGRWAVHFALRKCGCKKLSTAAEKRLWKELKKLGRGWVLVEVESAKGEEIKIVL